MRSASRLRCLCRHTTGPTCEGTVRICDHNTSVHVNSLQRALASEGSLHQFLTGQCGRRHTTVTPASCSRCCVSWQEHMKDMRALEGPPCYQRYSVYRVTVSPYRSSLSENQYSTLVHIVRSMAFYIHAVASAVAHCICFTN